MLDTVPIHALTVLIVEPLAVQRHIVKRMLDGQGISQVREAPTGELALKALAEARPDVVISAFYLPDMTGAELVQTLRKDGKFEDTTFLLVSSETDWFQLDPVRQAGPTAILPKPIKEADLVTALNATVDYLNAEDEDDDEFDFESLKVLVVDDARVARKYIARTLEKLGIRQIMQAGDGREAITLLDEHYFDIVLTDYNMPNMDGRELVAFIRDQSNQPSVPVMMVTSEEDGERLAAVHQAGVSAICDKPFELEGLRRLIQQLLSA